MNFFVIALVVTFIGYKVIPKDSARQEKLNITAAEIEKAAGSKEESQDKVINEQVSRKDNKDRLINRTAATINKKAVTPDGLTPSDSDHFTGLTEYMDRQSKGPPDDNSIRQEIRLGKKAVNVDLLKKIPSDQTEPPVADWVDAEIKTLIFTGFDEPEKSIADLFRQGKYDQLEKLVSENDLMKDIQKQYLFGELEFANSRYPEAVKHYETLLSTGVKSEFSEYAMFRKAECLYNTGEFEQALNFFNRIVSQNDFLIPEIEFSKAQCWLKMGKTEKALGIMEQLISKYEGYYASDRINYCIGLILYYQKRNIEALEFFRKVHTPNALFYSAKCLESEGRLLPAVSIFKNIIEKHKKSNFVDDAIFNLGMGFYHMKEYSSAAESFIKLLTEYPKSRYGPYARFMLGSCRFDMGLHRTAIINCNYFFRDYPGFEPEAHIRHLLAKSYAKLRQYKLAADEYKKIIADCPGTPIGLYAAYDLALLYYFTGKYDNAVKYCDISREMAEESVHEKNILFLKGICFYRKGNTVSAQEQFQGIINSVGDILIRGKSLFMLGLIYTAEEKYEALITGYFDLADKEGLFSDEWRSWAYYFIATAYYNLGKSADARKVSEYVLKYYSGTQAAKYAKNTTIACAVLNDEYSKAELINQEFLDSYGDDENVKKISLLTSAGIYFNRKNYGKAILLYKDFTENYHRDDNAYEALFMEGESFYRLGHYNEATDCWEKIVKINTDSEYFRRAYERLAYTSFGLGKYDDAILYYRKIRKYFPESELSREAGLHIARSYYNGGKYGQAINEYKKFLRNYPDHKKKEEVLENIRMVYYERGMEKADDDTGLIEFVRLYPEGNMAGEGYWQLGTRAYGRGQYQKAVKIFRRIISDYPQIESSKQALYYLAECLYALKKNDEAVNVFESFIKSFPDDDLSTAAEFHMANALFSMGKIEESQKYYSNIMNNMPDADFAPDAMLNKALGYKKLKKWKEAIREYELFYEKYAGHEKKGYAMFQVAEINRNTGNYRKAAGYYKQILPTDKISKSELLYLAADCYQKAGDFDNAKKYYTALVNLKTREKTFYLAGLVKLAEFYLQEGKDEEAVESYKKIMANTENEEWIAAAETKIVEIEEKIKNRRE